ncbi:hypothetical protein K461DRAFT_269567 [Myriangium duriaei CBS 260.36]|uniref:Uncharacterized protein n=1 Tax=Myriangium duriaei CBS 260.36 TaxID=1168546 RepID=A0A9P4ML25_9PEZI|nr:hypothetical protein K461DRAFT_269567 [Myriangium duriaei CBS 260.36]
MDNLVFISKADMEAPNPVSVARRTRLAASIESLPPELRMMVYETFAESLEEDGEQTIFQYQLGWNDAQNYSLQDSNACTMLVRAHPRPLLALSPRITQEAEQRLPDSQPLLMTIPQPWRLEPRQPFHRDPGWFRVSDQTWRWLKAREGEITSLFNDVAGVLIRVQQDDTAGGQYTASVLWSDHRYNATPTLARETFYIGRRTPGEDRESKLRLAWKLQESINSRAGHGLACPEIRLIGDFLVHEQDTLDAMYELRRELQHG